jgi:beta-glucosidase
MKQTFALLLCSCLVLASCSHPGDDSRVEQLLARMTLEEKIGQLNQYTGRWEMTGPAPDNEYAQEALEMIQSGQVGSLLNVTGSVATRNAQQLAVEHSRLGIPLLFGYDVIHGYRTIFPIPLGEAASWEPDLAEKTARVAALEATAAGVHWTFGPMVDIARDARWGRIMEGSGEDPFLGSRFAAARVKGFQGGDLSDAGTMAACAKHFAAYGFVESGRDYNTVEIDERTLWNVVLPPFRACLDAGVATFMNAFTEVDGIPSTANSYLVRDILKGKWEFGGFVVSDWNSVGELIPHGVAADRKEAAALAITAGCDMDMEGNCYIRHLEELVEEGTVDEALVDEAVRRVLQVKERLGLFDDPYRYCNEEREEALLLSDEHLALAREVARRSIVLLKNDRGLLPLKKQGQRIALIGELAADKDSPLGNWRGQAITGSAVSVLEGLQGQLMNPTLLGYERGPRYLLEQPGFPTAVQINTADRTGMDEAVAAARRSDVAVVVIGENCYQSGEARSVSDLRLKGLQVEMLERILQVNRNVVVVLMNGRPLNITGFIDRVPSVLVAWQAGSESGNAIADVLLGEYNPSGRLPVSWPRAVGQLPIYYNHKNTGRPENESGEVFWSQYTDLSPAPLFPFGFGLSYTGFEYSDLSLDRTTMGMEDSLRLEVTVTNTGDRYGEEVVQLYVRDLVGTVTRPVRELKGFGKIGLEPGVSAQVAFTLRPEDLYYFGKNMQWGVDPGEFRVWIGPNSEEGPEASIK